MSIFQYTKQLLPKLFDVCFEREFQIDMKAQLPTYPWRKGVYYFLKRILVLHAFMTESYWISNKNPFNIHVALMVLVKYGWSKSLYVNLYFFNLLTIPVNFFGHTPPYFKLPVLCIFLWKLLLPFLTIYPHEIYPSKSFCYTKFGQYYKTLSCL